MGAQEWVSGQDGQITSFTLAVVWRLREKVEPVTVGLGSRVAQQVLLMWVRP